MSGLSKPSLQPNMLKHPGLLAFLPSFLTWTSVPPPFPLFPLQSITCGGLTLGEGRTRGVYVNSFHAKVKMNALYYIIL